METKNLKIELKADGDEGKISGYGAVFGNVDSYGDRILKGAFTESLKSTKPKMLWQHDMYNPIGVWDEIYEDEKGLYVEGRLATGSAQGADAYALAKMGALDGLSIGYMAKAYDESNEVRELQEIELFEISMVTMPANDLATITGIKSAQWTERDFERALRNMGFGRADAKLATAHGFKAVLEKRDAGLNSELDELRDAGVFDALKQLNQTMGA